MVKNIIETRETNCKDCYKCIRNCSVKAISCVNDHAKIINKACVYCGNCVLVCPQSAKYFNSDVEKVKKMIEKGEKVYVSLAPSYVAGFPNMSLQTMSSAIKMLGFTGVEETAVGADMVTKEYIKLIERSNMPNIITSACVSANMLIEKYFPTLTQYLAPVITPANAHSKMMKQIYGSRVKIVFIGPCVAKKVEATQEKAYSAVLTFDELEKWFKSENIDLTQIDKNAKRLKNTLARYYPAPGGIIQNIPKMYRQKYECISVDGIDRCIEILSDIRKNKLTGYFIEMNICENGCLGGPILKEMGKSYLKSKNILMDNVRKLDEPCATLTDGIVVNMRKEFSPQPIEKKCFSEEEIRKVLASIGKITKDKELNCGCCGYPTCREKAIAVLEGKANVKMCLPYMRELAESMSNAVVENTPTGIIILNEEMNVIEANPSAIKILKLKRQPNNMNIEQLLPMNNFKDILTSDKDVIENVKHYEKLDLILEQTVVYVKDSQLVFVLMHDITLESKLEENRVKVRQETVDVAKQVITKQMQVVQEIAGLLGDTTAETKSALAKLTRSIEEKDR